MTNYNPKIAIIIPTILRDELLIKCLESILDNWNDDLKIIIIDQNKEEDDINTKKECYELINFHNQIEKKIEIIRVPFNSGISYCRNIGVQLAKEQNIPYCLISADSILLNNSFKNINKVLEAFGGHPVIDKIGFEINNRISWEGWIRLIPNEHFELTYIDKKTPNFNELIDLYECNICRNFFIAKTESLFDVKWDENLIMGEHEDNAIRYSEKYHTYWTPIISSDYIGDESKRNGGAYSILRKQNWNEGKNKLLEKYSLKRWIVYKNNPLTAR